MVNSCVKLIRLRIITPEGVMFDEDIELFETCLGGGYAGIMYGHAKIISYLSEKPSKIFCQNKKKLICLFNGGLICVDSREIKIFAKMFAFVDKSDRSKIKTNYENLLKTLKETDNGYKRMQIEAMLEFELQKLRWVN